MNHIKTTWDHAHHMNKVEPYGIVEGTGRDGRTEKQYVSRTLNLMASFGIVSLEKDKKNVRPIVKATSFQVEFGLKQAFGQAGKVDISFAKTL